VCRHVELDAKVLMVDLARKAVRDVVAHALVVDSHRSDRTLVLHLIVKSPIIRKWASRFGSILVLVFVGRAFSDFEEGGRTQLAAGRYW